MKKKIITTLLIIGIISALLGTVLSILSITETAFPKWLYLVASVGMLAYTAGLISNYIEVKKKQKEAAEQQQ